MEGAPVPHDSLLPPYASPRSVKASHILISVDGKVYLSGLRSNLSMISHGQRQRVVHDFPKYSIKVLPWLSPEVLQQVCTRSRGAPALPPCDFPREPSGLSWGGVLSASIRVQCGLLEGGFPVDRPGRPLAWA